MNKLIFLPVLSFFLVTTAVAQKKIVFPDKANVCFVGNSITQNGEYLHYIRTFYATRFPEKQVNFFNCGISGDVTGGILNRLEGDIMIHRPDYAVIMIGMNDVNRPLYSAKRANEDSIEYKKQQALLTYKTNLEKIIRYFLDKKVKVILQKPSIYDQTAAGPTENLKGANDALATCAGYMQSFADHFKLPIVDYQTIMLEINKQWQQKDSTATIVGKDRVHPGSPGHFVMGWQFLYTTLGTTPVAVIAIDAESKKPYAVNAKVDHLMVSPSMVAFEYLPKGLPFYVSPDAQPALSAVPFTNTLNQELLQVRGLAPGNYQVFINQTLVTHTSATKLQQGLDLSTLNTPQRQQAQQVTDLCWQYRNTENEIRMLKLVEFRYLAKYEHASNADSALAYVGRQLANPTPTNFPKAAYEKYVANKRNEAALKEKLDSLGKQIFSVNRPRLLQVRIEHE